MDDDLDLVFKALADPTRRQILDLLRDGPRTTTSIVERFPGLSRFGVMKHLTILKQCELVVTTRHGREVHNALNAVPLRRIQERWIGRFSDLWARTLLDVKDAAEGKRRR